MMIQTLRSPFEDWFKASRSLAQQLELFLNGFHRYQSKIDLEINTPQFCLRTVRSMAELHSLFQMRHSVFGREFRKDQKADGLDFDLFDHECDHLLILEKSTRQIIGTYRMRIVPKTLSCYTQQEFQLQKLSFNQDRILELGRACIIPRFRKSQVLQLLWRGIAQYSHLTQAEHLLGCTSVLTLDPVQISDLIHHLDSRGWVSSHYKASVQEIYKISDWDVIHSSRSTPANHGSNEAAQMMTIPPLLISYLRAGAQVILDPAFDREYNCTDLLTHLDFKKMSAAHRRRFFGQH